MLAAVIVLGILVVLLGFAAYSLRWGMRKWRDAHRDVTAQLEVAKLNVDKLQAQVQRGRDNLDTSITMREAYIEALVPLLTTYEKCKGGRWNDGADYASSLEDIALWAIREIDPHWADVPEADRVDGQPSKRRRGPGTPVAPPDAGGSIFD